MSLLDAFEPVQYRDEPRKDVADERPVMVWETERAAEIWGGRK